MASVFICRCHDRIEQGVSIPRGPSEWDLAPAINEAIHDQVWLTDHNPVMLSSGTLTRRVKSINTMSYPDGIVSPPYYAIEVHCNWSADPDRQGFFVMAHHRSAKGRALALTISASMANVLGHDKNRGINKVDSKRQWIGRRYQYKAERQYFVSKTVCPAVLVEVGFLSNPDEAMWLSKAENRARLGKAIGLGITEYLKGVSNE